MNPEIENPKRPAEIHRPVSGAITDDVLTSHLITS